MKNIVVCFDGTSNRIKGAAGQAYKPGGNNTNVVKLFRAIKDIDPIKQVAFCDPGGRNVQRPRCGHRHERLCKGRHRTKQDQAQSIQDTATPA